MSIVQNTLASIGRGFTRASSGAGLRTTQQQVRSALASESPATMHATTRQLLAAPERSLASNDTLLYLLRRSRTAFDTGDAAMGTTYLRGAEHATTRFQARTGLEVLSFGTLLACVGAMYVLPEHDATSVS